MIKTATKTETVNGWQVCFSEYEAGEMVYTNTVEFSTLQDAQTAILHYLNDYEDILTFED